MLVRRNFGFACKNNLCLSPCSFSILFSVINSKLEIRENNEFCRWKEKENLYKH